MKHLKVSVITVCFNSASTIEDTIKSVINQSYPNIEYVIIDGGSTDGTPEIIKKYHKNIAYWVSEKDKGIYDAMNKGIRAATGDVVSILNSDDMYDSDTVIEEVVRILSEEGVDSCYGDALYVDRDNIDKAVRYWKAGEFSRDNIRRGWMPCHPAFFVKKEVYDKYGIFRIDLPVVADYELMLRFLYKFKVSSAYIPKVTTRVRIGGDSRPGLLPTLKHTLGCYKAWQINELRVNPFALLLKPLSKLPQYLYAYTHSSQTRSKAMHEGA